MDPRTRSFLQHRARVRGIAYRMLGSLADADDLVQDVWLRWRQCDDDEVQSPEAWLVTAATRLAIDRLRALRRSREHYPGLWLPEPVLGDGTAESPEDELERLGEVSVALQALLERLTPAARAAFLLREVFELDYDELARMLGKTPAGCRQLVSRAKAALGDEARRGEAPAGEHERLLAAFARATAAGDFAPIQALLAADASLQGDGGGQVASVPHPLLGARRIAQLYFANALRWAGRLRWEPVRLNGRPGLLRFVDGRLESAQSFEFEGGRILRISVQRNPAKLARLQAAWQARD
ncbi:MAG: sigma-70 family RNA polymerase sigma factor [Rubrivivax sp.]